MKRFLGLILIALMAFSVSSCYVSDHRRGHVPPGQAKKRYGGKSAKRYAPGQQKKQHKAKKGKGSKKDAFWDQLRR